jgi:hypothetical protein
MTAIKLSDARALVQQAYTGDFRSIARLLSGLVEGDVRVERNAVLTNATAVTISREDSGKTFFVPDLTGDATITLPTLEAGLDFTFVYAGAATDAQDWIITSTGATLWTGGLLWVNPAGASGDEATVLYAAAAGNVMNVFTPQAGTRVHVWSDGTNWYVEGQVIAASTPSFT